MQDLSRQHCSLQKTYKLLDYVHTMSVKQNQDRICFLERRVTGLQALMNSIGAPWSFLHGSQRVASSSCTSASCSCRFYCVALKKPCCPSHAAEGPPSWVQHHGFGTRSGFAWAERGYSRDGPGAPESEGGYAECPQVGPDPPRSAEQAPPQQSGCHAKQ